MEEEENIIILEIKQTPNEHHHHDSQPNSPHLPSKPPDLKRFTSLETISSQMSNLQISQEQKLETATNKVSVTPPTSSDNIISSKSICERYQQMEENAEYCCRQNYLSPSITSKMREATVNFLVKIHMKFKLRPETLYLGINIFDRFLARNTTVDFAKKDIKKLKLVGCVSQFIASKYEDISFPEVGDYLYYIDKHYNQNELVEYFKRDEFVEMELIVMTTLRHHFTVPTSFLFLLRYLPILNIFPSVQKTCEHSASFILQYCFLNLDLVVQYAPSLLAFCSIKIMIENVGSFLPSNSNWLDDLEIFSGYKWNDENVRNCLRDIRQTLSNFKNNSISKKFGRSKYGKVTLLFDKYNIL